MTLQEFETFAKAKLQVVANATAAFFEAHPDIESDAATLLKNTADDAASAATTEVEQAAPVETQAILDAAIKAIQDQADKEIAAIQAAKATVKP